MDRPPNQAARVAAVCGVILLFVVAILIVATAGGGGSDSSGNNSQVTSTSTGPDTTDPRIEKALQNGIYVVQEGDTLTSISADTGIDVDTLVTLNPNVDPQLLAAGTHLKLK
jgi:LysM repeat protein